MGLTVLEGAAVADDLDSSKEIPGTDDDAISIGETCFAPEKSGKARVFSEASELVGVVTRLIGAASDAVVARVLSGGLSPVLPSICEAIGETGD